MSTRGFNRIINYSTWLIGFLMMLTIMVPASARTIRLVAFGDSLTAGYMLPAADAFPARLEAALREKGHDVSIINAGVSGDTTSGGLARLDWSIPEGTDGVILELGANDALRGINPSITEQALDAMIMRLKSRNIMVLLAGMYAPRNNGADYGAKFDAIYPRLAAKHDVLLYPFFLDGVAGEPSLNLPDMLHPNAVGVGVIVARVLPITEAFLAKIIKK